VLAHVDHGKTTLTDHLLASNALVHPRLAGELRFMDSRDDEQARGITMKSSAVALLHRGRPEAVCVGGGGGGANSGVNDDADASSILINLIDSPGHVDFCSEVGAAARLADGALVLVDAVEGVCIQTHAVLRAAHAERLGVCLVINKVDRLATELGLSPAEGGARLEAIVAHANMVASGFESEAAISEADAVLAGAGEGGNEEDGGAAAAAAAAASTTAAPESAPPTFDPVRGNVAFASAADGWAFTTADLARLAAPKLGCPPDSPALKRALWGAWSLDGKAKKVVPLKARTYGAPPPRTLFVQVGLEPVWRAYGSAAAAGPGADDAPGPGSAPARMAASLGLGPAVAKTAAGPSARAAGRAVLAAWLPLAPAILGMAASHLPSPLAAAPTRVPGLLAGRVDSRDGAAAAQRQGQAGLLPPGTAAAVAAVEAAAAACDASPGAPLLGYIGKMFAVPAASIPPRAGAAAAPPLVGAAGEEEVFLAFTRVFAGVLKDGAPVHALHAAHDPARPSPAALDPIPVDGLFLMMGRGLARVAAAPAGSVVAVGGLGGRVVKAATLASSPAARPLAPVSVQAAPIVRVAVEAAHPADAPALARGLTLLDAADPMVEVSTGPGGEHLLGAAGEVHLETAIGDLGTRFARCELVVSPPLAAFRESVAWPPDEAAGTAGGGGVVGGPAAPPPALAPPRTVEATTPGGSVTVRTRAHPLPPGLAGLLDGGGDDLRALLAAAGGEAGGGGGAGVSGEGAPTPTTTTPSSSSLTARLAAAAADPDWPAGGALLARAWALGPGGCGPVILLASGGSGSGGGGNGPPPPPLFAQADPVLPAAAALRRVGAGAATTGAGAAAVAAAEGQDLADGLAALALSSSAAAAAACHAGGGSGGGSRPFHLRVGRPAAAAALGWSPAPADLTPPSLPPALARTAADVEAGIASGFQMAAGCGPMCDEPLWGVALEVDARLNGVGGGGEGGDLTLPDAQEAVYGPLAGQVAAAARAALRGAVAAAHPRLVEPTLLAEVTAAEAGALGGVYAALGRRRARVLREDLREGTGVFTIHAHLPAAGALGLAGDLRARTGGAASASLLLSHWARLAVDPYFVPTTEEQREEFGEEGQGAGGVNTARAAVDAVRTRKGLPVAARVVESATKQRTRARKV